MPTRIPTRTHPLPAPVGTTTAGVLALTLALLLTACGGEERTHDITDIRERSEPMRPAKAGVSTVERFAGRTQTERSPRSPASITWVADTPEGWEALPPKPMRDLGYRVAGDENAECTFTILEGTGGGLLANVNRWRRQMGLDPTTEEVLAANLEKRPFLGTEALLIDIEGTYGGMRGEANMAKARMLGLILPLPQRAVFLKMVGPADVVEAERERFLELATTIRPAPADTARMPPGHGRTPTPPPGQGGERRGPAPLTWKLPEGWEKRPDRAMRVVTAGPAGAERTECYVSILGGTGGGVAMNINRWRGQMNQAPLSADELATLPRVQVLGGEGVLVTIEQGDFRGQGGEEVDKAAMLGFVLERSDNAIFVKMTGPADVVLRERGNFEAFVRSLGEQ